VTAKRVAGIRGVPYGAVRLTLVSTDHHQGVCLYLVKVTELFKKTLNLKS